MAGSIIELHTEVPADQESNVFGQFDEHLKLIERTLNVTVISRDGVLKILGSEQNAASAKKLIDELVVLAKRGNTITRQNVNYALSLAMEQRNEVLTEIEGFYLQYHSGQTNKAQDSGTEGICRPDPQKNDCFRSGACRYR